ncbi:MULTISPECIES: PP2C family protein-serine/threonine phosphatase [Streptomycetaceae]|uniref:protein-serine/threonine phosphatase n=1 Tax=Streptantibioticus cattleyicolor (strain ATCC 35852 / DSM 46488 / JCM 4925 / NBRC 14057 / NRRL 8057) TaxID=1003195 RepID=F8K3S0_STREN|nr:MULTISPECIES: GAF domain-containing SpoIIE family protein phosphatase [Streptomycetaceae]AEW97609.1 magnesium or manganese-dependent protein phosphatase [Streptantibioticus cattleyicolor NRRL 8057 = DSM 46488]MYS62038.1 SpoIIE family protein phosphatase [Streptomyces sp. SID5468]CCB77931.1 Magnesium or manganese-dependent protein phosphatase [Streptantibioticus cattleyicolor NRRL 8057 = DSM 46488]
MTAPPEVWKIASVTDAALARAAVGAITTAGGSPALERARFLTALTARLRRCLNQGGEWELLLHLRHDTGAQDGRVDVLLRPVDASWPSADDEPALTCPLPHQPVTGRVPARTPLPEALLRADENTAAVLDLLQEQERLVQLHREELHHTNQGVLALHSHLEAAALAQRELLEAERAARAEAERARRLLTFLGDASAAITVSLSPTAILRRLSDLLVPEYATRLDVWLFDEEDAPGHVREHAAAAVVAARTGRPQHAGPRPGNLPGIGDLPPSALSPERPLLAIPLGAHRLLGVLTLTAPGPRFDADTCITLVELARRVGIALDNARRYEQYRDTAETLQRAQLTDLPAVPGLLLTARYLPATWGLNIGGDWYDAFRQPDGSLLVVIGDVTGHGLHAAVVMGQLRTALRAYAIDDTSPGEILTQLHRMLRHLQPELYATALIARIRPGEPRVVWASAGHPPAVVRDDDGTVRVLDGKPGVMLGIPADHTYTDQVTRLPTGSSLVLYTDGLVERRARGIDAGIERLAQALAALRTPELEQDLDAGADAVLKHILHDSERDDDVCLLVCHRLTAIAQEPLPSA